MTFQGVGMEFFWNCAISDAYLYHLNFCPLLRAKETVIKGSVVI